MDGGGRYPKYGRRSALGIDSVGGKIRTEASVVALANPVVAISEVGVPLRYPEGYTLIPAGQPVEGSVLGVPPVLGPPPSWASPCSL